MKLRTKVIIKVIILYSLCCLSAGEAAVLSSQVSDTSRLEVMVTIYNNNYGLIREVREVTLPRGIVALEFQGVAKDIDPTSVVMKSLTAPGELKIIEQKYRFDLLSRRTLLDRYIGRKVKYSQVIDQGEAKGVERVLEKVFREGLLLATDPEIVQFGDEVEISPLGTISLLDLPSDLLSKPTLIWLLDNNRRGSQKIETSYLTDNLSWQADYVGIVNRDDDRLDLTGWVTLTNNSGANYPDAILKLVAGDVRRVAARVPERMRMAVMQTMQAERIQPEDFFEYHLYQIPRRTTLRNKETKQLRLLEGSDIKISKVLRFTNSVGSFRIDQPIDQHPEVVLSFLNSSKNGLGVPLPAGRVRLYKADSGGALQFTGEDRIDHLPVNEEVKLEVGRAFDVVLTRKQTRFRRLDKRTTEVGFSILVRNRKKSLADIEVIEQILGDWAITKESDQHELVDARSIRYSFTLGAGKQKEVTYTARITN